jgi:hypothetical protein
VVHGRPRQHKTVDQRDSDRDARAEREGLSIKRDFDDPCNTSSSPKRANAIGIAHGWPSHTKLTVATSASSRIA